MRSWAPVHVDWKQLRASESGDPAPALASVPRPTREAAQGGSRRRADLVRIPVPRVKAGTRPRIPRRAWEAPGSPSRAPQGAAWHALGCLTLAS